jgi:hypothetical protein
MEVIFALPLIIIPLFFPLTAGLMARSFGRNFKFWFWMGVFFPVIAHCILLCLPERPEELSNSRKVV